MVSQRENLLRFYRHEQIDHFATYLDGDRFLFEANGFLERPPYHKSGKDWFGVPWIYDTAQAAFVPDHTQKPVLEDICDWREVVKWPDLDAMDWEAAVKSDNLEVFDRENFVFSVWDGCGPFERLHSLMGFEGALMAMVAEPEETAAFLERFTEYKTKLIKYICKYYKPDVFQFQDDCGTNKGTFYSPETWRKLIKPVWQAEIDAIHSCGVIAELHSCGNGTAFFVEMADTGLDCLFIQPINDIKKIREATGGKIALMIQTEFAKYSPMLAAGIANEEDIRQMTYNNIKELLEGGNGSDYLAMAMPPAGADAEDSFGSLDNVANAIIWSEVYSHMDEWNDIIKAKQGR